MKTVVFVCLLSLSMCLSQPATNSEASAASPTQQSVTDAKTATTPKIDEKSGQKATSTETDKKVPSQSDAAHENKTPQTPEKVIDDNKTEHKESKGTNETTTGKPTEKASSVPAETKPSENKPVPAPIDTKPTANANNAVVPVDNKDKKNETTTVHPAVVTPTVAPNVTEKPAVLARGFDGASFVGGIILTLGLLAIGFMGFKYYKNQTERNYHTL